MIRSQVYVYEKMRCIWCKKTLLLSKMLKFDEKEQNKKLRELRKKEEEDLARILSEKYGLGYADLSRTTISNEALQLIGETDARNAEVAAFGKVGKKISLAVHSPNKKEVSDILRGLEDRGYEITSYMVSSQSLLHAWERYKDLSFAVKTKAGVLDISGDEIRNLIHELKTIEDIKQLIQKTLAMKKAYRISRILETVLAGGFASNASDVHIEPEEKNVRMRYRLDGVLTDILMFDLETYKLLLSRIKLISGLKLNVKNSAQDGRFSVKIDQESIEIRTSILPGAYGESIVLRILQPSTIALPMEELGIEPHLLSALKREIRKPNGMILNTGPTGSGKTTTLYAFLKSVHTPQIKIITIEDPIEYHLPGIVQTQVDKKKYTFASGLRSTLRQDPDVIMVGEIRDEEVAETAINAALTGHLVFSTLHTNTAAGSFPRLIDLGVNPKVIGSAVNIVMAQRLIRKLCEECKKEVPLEGERKTLVESILNSIVNKENVPEQRDVVWEAVGCDKCGGSGFKGRIGIFEAIIMDDAIEKLVKESASEHDIEKGARGQGIMNMKEDGLLKVLKGVTSLEELERMIEFKEDSL